MKGELFLVLFWFLASWPSGHPAVNRYKQILWIILGIGVQYFEGVLKEVSTSAVSVLHNGSASFTHFFYYFVLLSQLHLKALSVTINTGQAEVLKT